MDERLSDLEQRLAAVERRLSRLESQTPGASLPEEIPGDSPTLGDGFLSNASTLIGRVLLIFGGAYLLRAITDYQVVPTGVGLSLGAAYALFWLFRAFVIGRDSPNQTTALFFGGASVLLALPLLAEATGRFEMLSGGQGIFALSIFCALCLFVAVSRDLRLLAWAIVVGGIVTAFAVLQITHSALPAGAFLVLLGLMSLWACYVKGWKGPQWLGAVGAVVGVLSLTLFTRSEQWSIDARAVFLIGAALLLTYLASFAVRTHRQRHAVGTFESIQTLLAIAVTLLTAFAVLRNGQLSAAAIGVPAVALAAAVYALAFTRGTRTERGRNFHYYSTVGLLLLVAGSALLLAPVYAAALWSVLAMLMAWLSGRYARVSLSLQCTFLLLAAGIGSGLLETGLIALAGGAPQSWPPILPWHAVVALTTVACLFIPVAQQSRRWGALAGLPQLIVLALSVWEVGGLFVVYTAPLLVDFGSGAPDRAILAALRTMVLAAASLTLAISSRHPRWPEARWLVYPVLILVGIKLFIEDFPHGQPVTLFIALAIVGSALILVAKLLSQGKSGD